MAAANLNNTRRFLCSDDRVKNFGVRRTEEIVREGIADIVLGCVAKCVEARSELWQRLENPGDVCGLKALGHREDRSFEVAGALEFFEMSILRALFRERV